MDRIGAAVMRQMWRGVRWPQWAFSRRFGAAGPGSACLVHRFYPPDRRGCARRIRTRGRLHRLCIRFAPCLHPFRWNASGLQHLCMQFASGLGTCYPLCIGFATTLHPMPVKKAAQNLVVEHKGMGCTLGSCLPSSHVPCGGYGGVRFALRVSRSGCGPQD